MVGGKQMDKCSSKDIIVNISEDVTIIEVSAATQKFNSEIYISKVVNGTPHHINLKSLLGLINIQLKNGDHITVKAEGSDCEEALAEVIQFLS